MSYARSVQYAERYDLPVWRYHQILEAQKGVCAICKKGETAMSTAGNVRRLSVDHDHATGKIRGLLCHSCNIFVGYVDTIKNNPDKVKLVEEYFTKGLPP